VVCRRNKAFNNSFAESGLRQTNSNLQQILLRKGTYFMKTAPEYRAMAEECFKWALDAQADEVRMSLQQLAHIWLDAASKLDGLPATRLATTPDALHPKRLLSPNVVSTRMRRGGSR
jgi:hypothetical protein